MVLERRAVLQSVAKVLIGLPGREPSAFQARFRPTYSPRQGQGRALRRWGRVCPPLDRHYILSILCWSPRVKKAIRLSCCFCLVYWRALGDSNPCRRRERALLRPTAGNGG